MKKINFICSIFLASALMGACKQGKSEKKFIGSNADGVGLTVEDTAYFRPLSQAEKDGYAQKADLLFNKMYGSNFNGQFLIAKNGQIVFEKYMGTYDFRKKTPMSPDEPMHLASISKTFTGMAILHLWEEGKIQLTDSIQKYIPQFPYQGITVKMLLEHRSGLPNYLDFMTDRARWDYKRKASNQDVIDVMIQQQPPMLGVPDRTFHYCNTNFMLLASILEKVTGQLYPKWMKDSLFTPLGMTHTHVFEMKDTADYVMTYSGNRPYPLDPTDCTYGDKNIYSTVRDLLLWDRALYSNKFIKASTLKMALEPSSHERVSMHNYGMAWRMYFAKNGDSIIYHNGHWHGSNTVFTRLIQDTATIIAIGNRGDKRVYGAKLFTNIFTGKEDYMKVLQKPTIPTSEMQGETEKASPVKKRRPNVRKSR